MLTTERTDQIEARLGIDITDVWQAGVLARWFVEQSDGTDWGAGAYLKMAVDPNATIAVADWLPGVGAWMKLPETLEVETYLIGKLLYADHDEIGMSQPDTLSAAVGGGFQIGPAIVEVVYSIVEGGDQDGGMVESGLEVWFGGCLEF